ncbi:MAG: helix-turn-helix domain-containing protein [Sporosarcina sp.]
MEAAAIASIAVTSPFFVPGSATKTAEKLHIHINTLYQRIRKIEHLLQLDLNDNEDSLKIHLACHLRSTYL